MLLEASALVLSAERGSYGYLLKPPPRSFDVKLTKFVPANEHFTMQLARQVFGLRVAACYALPTGSPLPT